jgi:hypothetical protein
MKILEARKLTFADWVSIFMMAVALYLARAYFG